MLAKLICPAPLGELRNLICGPSALAVPRAARVPGANERPCRRGLPVIPVRFHLSPTLLGSQYPPRRPSMDEAGEAGLFDQASAQQSLSFIHSLFFFYFFPLASFPVVKLRAIIWRDKIVTSFVISQLKETLSWTGGYGLPERYFVAFE